MVIKKILLHVFCLLLIAGFANSKISFARRARMTEQHYSVMQDMDWLTVILPLLEMQDDMFLTIGENWEEMAGRQEKYSCLVDIIQLETLKDSLANGSINWNEADFIFKGFPNRLKNLFSVFKMHTWISKAQSGDIEAQMKILGAIENKMWLGLSEEEQQIFENRDLFLNYINDLVILFDFKDKISEIFYNLKTDNYLINSSIVELLVLVVIQRDEFGLSQMNNDILNSMLDDLSSDIKKFQDASNGDEDKLLLGLNLGKEVVKSGMLPTSLFKNAFPNIVNRTTLQQFEMATDLGFSLLSMKPCVGPCNMLWHLVPIAITSTDTFEEYEQVIDDIENIIERLVSKGVYPGYMIKYAIPIIGRIATNMDDVSEMVIITQDFFKAIQEWRNDDARMEISNRLEQFIADNEEEIISSEQQMHSVANEENIGNWKVKAPPMQDLYSYIDERGIMSVFETLQDLSIDLESFRSIVALETKCIGLQQSLITVEAPFVLSYTWGLKMKRSEADEHGKLDCDDLRKRYWIYPRLEGDYYIFDRFAFAPIVRSFTGIPSLQAITPEVVEIVSSDLDIVTLWVTRLNSLDDMGILNVIVSNKNIVLSYFNGREEKDWLRFVGALDEYIDINLGPSLILTKEFIDTLLQ